MLTPEQKKKRLEGIGGSEIAAIAGLSPYATALDVWRAKVEGFEQPDSPHMERGRFLEAGIADWYAHRTGAQLREVGTITHPSLRRVMCTPDRLAKKDGEWGLSIKAPGPRAEGWGESGTDNAPMVAVIQVHWELITLEPLYGIRHEDISAPIDGELRIYTVHADAELQGQLIEAGQRFWRDFVETGKPPPLDGSESCARWLADKFPENRAPLLPPTPEADAIMRRLKEIREEKAKAEALEAAAIAELKALLGEHEGMAADAWKVTWKNTKGSVKTDWEAIARELKAPQSLVEKFSNITKGSRRFVPTWREQ
jgi:putative phage-type endonuclease